MQIQIYPPLPAHIRAEILRRLTVLELLIVVERFGTRQIAGRLGEDFQQLIQKAANNGEANVSRRS